MTISLDSLATRLYIEDQVVKMFVATDERDWVTLESCFTTPFILDMTSMVGGDPMSLTPQQVAAAWAEGFKPLTHVHHQIGNLRTTVGAGVATVRCYGIALHYRSTIATDQKSRRFVGTYEMDLKADDHWRISRLQFKLKFIDGNIELEKAT